MLCTRMRTWLCESACLLGESAYVGLLFTEKESIGALCSGLQRARSLAATSAAFKDSSVKQISPKTEPAVNQ